MIDNYSKHIMDSIDTSLVAPEREPQRQYYFMKKLIEIVKEKSFQAGRSLTYHVETFGCPTV